MTSVIFTSNDVIKRERSIRIAMSGALVNIGYLAFPFQMVVAYTVPPGHV